jgi:hypothetical protein
MEGLPPLASSSNVYSTSYTPAIVTEPHHMLISTTCYIILFIHTGKGRALILVTSVQIEM